MLKYSYIASIAVHFAVAIVLYQRHSLHKPQTISIQITENKFKQVGSKQSHRRAHHKVVSAKRIKKLLPQLDRFSASGLAYKSMGNAPGDNPLSGWGHGGADFKKIEDYAFMEKIHHHVEGLLFYPSVLARNKIEGTANARLVFNREGNCDWHHTQMSSNTTYLKVYTLDLLKKLCKQNFAQYMKKKESINIDLSFTFAITEHDEKSIKDANNIIVGNVLMFYRNSQQSMAQWQLGPFTGMFPLPIVNLDFGWLTENWDKHIQNKDIFKEFKNN